MKMSPQYSRLAAAIDSGQMRERLQKQLGHSEGADLELRDFHIARVFPRSDDSFTIQYRMNIKSDKRNTSRPMILCGYLLGETENWPEYIETNKKQVMVFEDLRLIVPIFPFDPYLPAIAELCVKGDLPPAFQKGASNVIADLPNAGIVDFEVLGYRLERRCVVRYRLGDLGNNSDNPRTINIVIKIARPSKMKESKKCLSLLEKGGFAGNGNNGLTAPLTYHIDIKNGIQVSELAPGETLHNLTGDKRFSRACEKAALLLRKLHKVDSSSLTKNSITDELASLDGKIRLISSVFPEFASSFKSCLEIIMTSSQELDNDFESACVHRDFYDKQILYSAERSTLLDFDSLACGDSAQDFGNFIAHLLLRQLQEPINAQNISEGIRAFKSAYGFLDKSFEKRVNWWQVATLLRLGFLYSLRPEWHRLTGSLLKMAISNVDLNQTQKEGVNENYRS